MGWKATTYVTEHSKCKGSALLCMIMIAQYAHDDGKGAYPSEATLAQQCRMSERTIRRLVQAIADAGELKIGYKDGPHGCNTYTILGMLPDSDPDKLSTSTRTSRVDTRTSRVDYPDTTVSAESKNLSKNRGPEQAPTYPKRNDPRYDTTPMPPLDSVTFADETSKPAIPDAKKKVKSWRELRSTMKGLR